MPTGPLGELVAYHAPLSVIQREQGGAVTLLTPGVNVLALNATYLPADTSDVDMTAVQDWHEGQGLPALLASVQPVAGAREVARLRVGSLPPGAGADAGDVVVEQVSRLHLGTWARVLAQAHGTPDWAGALAHHLAARLEGDRSAALLLAYRNADPVGALLWRATPDGGAAHLWGALDGHAALAVLGGAAALGGVLRVSDTGNPELPLDGAQTMVYSLLSPQ